MARWEYAQLWREFGVRGTRLELQLPGQQPQRYDGKNMEPVLDLLRKLGDDGWELGGIDTFQPGKAVYYLKRPTA